MTAEDFDIAAPRAGALIEALRAVGYSLETAVADLIDNSIAAGAQNVRLSFHWAGQATVVSIVDDGRGMTEAELVEAMRPGSRNPLETRETTDLGRFGLGLKTASFSQCRRLKVTSKKDGGISTRCWDLDYVGRTGEWRLLKGAPGEELQDLAGQTSGTAVLWEHLDRVVGIAALDDRAAHDRFLGLVSAVKAHLEMVFHRFMTGARPRLRMWINRRDDRHALRPWDPFLEHHPSTMIISGEERLASVSGTVLVKGFVLPHKDRLSQQEFQTAAGPRGWLAQQGFYVYRNERLLVSGGWLGLDQMASEEHYKLARIRIDIPSSLDGEWAIDVKKSRARPPGRLRARLRELAVAVRARARKVYVHRGRESVGAGTEPLRRAWVSTEREGRVVYRIDRANPLVKSVLTRADEYQRPGIEAMLKLLEATVPVQQIWLDAIERPDAHGTAFEGDDVAHIREVAVAMLHALRADGVGAELARQRIATMPPFNQYPGILEGLAHIEE